MKPFLKNNNREMYLIHNEGKSDKYITSISENVYTDKLDDIMNKYKNTYHKTIKMLKNLLMQFQACILSLIKKIILKLLNLMELAKVRP